MRGRDDRGEGMFSDILLEERVPVDHPLREVRRLTDAVLAAWDGRFEAMYSLMGRPSIAPGMLLRARLLQAFSRSGSCRRRAFSPVRQVMERTYDNPLFRWCGGLPIAAAIGHPTGFSPNRERLMAADVAREFLAALPGLAQVKSRLASDPGYAISLRWRKRSAEVFGRIRAAVGCACVKVRSKPKADATFTLAAAACNLIRIAIRLARPATCAKPRRTAPTRPTQTAHIHKPETAKSRAKTRNLKNSEFFSSLLLFPT